MAIIIKYVDWWFLLTKGKCFCGKKLRRNNYYCSAKCLNDCMDREFDKFNKESE